MSGVWKGEKDVPLSEYDIHSAGRQLFCKSSICEGFIWWWAALLFRCPFGDFLENVFPGKW